MACCQQLLFSSPGCGPREGAEVGTGQGACPQEGRSSLWGTLLLSPLLGLPAMPPPCTYASSLGNGEGALLPEKIRVVRETEAQRGERAFREDVAEAGVGHTALVDHHEYSLPRFLRAPRTAGGKHLFPRAPPRWKLAEAGCEPWSGQPPANPFGHSTTTPAWREPRSSSGLSLPFHRWEYEAQRGTNNLLRVS